MAEHKLSNLEYEYDALEPYIDEKTMRIHHDKHHQGYVDKLNSALEKYPELKEKNAEELIKNLNNVPDDIRTAVINNGGGHINHSFFWAILKKNIEFDGKIAEEIKKEFESFENFKEKFTNSAVNLFGSGWTWLVLDDKKLEIINTQGHDSPLSDGKIPLLVLDIWEHSYYLKYQNKRAEYIEAFFNIINWDKVNDYFVKGR